MTDLAGTMVQKSRTPGKSATAFRTISEVSAELDVPQHVLRFWETKFPQIKPLKRGGGRRYYRPDDVELLRRIQHFLYKEGYTIKGVQRLLKETKGAPPDLPEAGEARPGGPSQRPTGGAPVVGLFDDHPDLMPEEPDLEDEPEEDEAPPPIRRKPSLTADKRRALEAVLAELEAIRDLLKD